MVTEFDVIPTIIAVLVLVIPAMLLGKLCLRFQVSEIIGFVVAGIILGPFALGGLIPYFDRPLVQLDDFMLSIWQISGIVILFSAGLHFTFHDLRRAGYRSAIVGTLGVIAPLGLGYIISILLGLDWTTSVIIGATLSATSIAASVTILEELGKEKTKEGNILVNAAVLDDVLGLAILSAVISIIVSHSLPSVEVIAFTTMQAIGFWFLILLGAVYFLPKLVHVVTVGRPSTLEARGTQQASALGSAFGLAAIAGSIGLNPIVGAFAAGMGLAGSKLAIQVKEFVGRLQVIFAPLFFAIMGAHVDINKIFETDWVVFLIILGVAVFSKILACGLPASLLLSSKKKGLRVGYGMVARGEIAFITAGIGVAYGILNDTIYSTLVFVILGTIFISPALLRNSYKKNQTNSEKH
jgi:Kef-type K+ transport system membrane component KefB